MGMTLAPVILAAVIVGCGPQTALPPSGPQPTSQVTGPSGPAVKNETTVPPLGQP